MLSVMRAIAASFPKKLALPKKRGFTLIEMSIVLVIIGLIIGGILKGQEVIAGARTKAVVNVINATRSAANTYHERYRALPGDDQNATTRVDPRLISGDGNGHGYGNDNGCAAWLWRRPRRRWARRWGR